MIVQKYGIIFASRLNQRAIEFYNSAECLRNEFSTAVHVIDYCTALSFELQLKSILALRNKFDNTSKNHKICELFDKCEIKLEAKTEIKLIKYYHTILNVTGRYAVCTEQDRKLLDDSLSGIFNKKIGFWGKNCESSVYEINEKSGIVNNTYKYIWKNICEIFTVAYDLALRG